MKSRFTWLAVLLVLAMALSACMPIQPMPEAAAEAGMAEAPAAEAPAAEAGDALAVLNEFASNIPEGWLSTGKIDDVNAAIDAGALLIDVREPDEYAEGHIPGAVNIPLRTLGQNLDKVPTDQPVLIYCQSGLRAGTATAALRVAGFQNVKSFPGSMKAWTAAGEEVSTEGVEAVPAAAQLDVDPATAAMVDEFLSGIPEGFYSVGAVEKLMEAMDAGMVLVDVREESEYAEGAIPGAINVPLRTLIENLDQIPQDQPVAVYCASGHRASMANALLHMAGFDNVRVFAAGYGAWEAAQDAAGEVPTEVAASMDSSFDIAVAVNDFLANIPEGYYSTGPVEKTQEMMEATSPLMIDVREESEYAEGHIPGAINIPLRTLSQNLDKVPADSPVVVYCASGHRAGTALTALQLLGYNNVKSFAGGWKAWSGADAEVQTEPVEAAVVAPMEVNAEMLAAVDEFLVNLPEGWFAVGDPAKVAEAIDAGAAVIDVREPDEFDQGHIAGAVSIPIRTLGASAAQIPTDQPVIVYCASGHRAAISNAALHIMGLDNVRSFPPGYGAWEAAGEAVEQ
jgi:rhodanese-related sulfurtransferase